MTKPVTYHLTKSSFLKELQKRARLGATHYLQISIPFNRFESLHSKFQKIYFLSESSSTRSKKKSNHSLAVANAVYFLDKHKVLLVLLFTLPPVFPDLTNKDNFKLQSDFLNSSFPLNGHEDFHSIYDKKHRLTISSEGYPVYSLEKLELPERLKRSSASHQWVFRLHKDFRKGKLEKIKFIIEKARNIKKGEDRETKRLPFYSMLSSELEKLNLLVPIWGIQDDITSIRKEVRKSVKKAHLNYCVDLFHPTYKGAYHPLVTRDYFFKKVRASFKE